VGGQGITNIITLSPKQCEAMDAIASEKYTFILFGGAMGGGKTFWGLSALLIMCKLFPKSRWCVVREDMEKIRSTTIPSFRKLNPPGRLFESPFHYVHPNGSEILFKGENFNNDKDLQWLRGLEVCGFLFEEINECSIDTFQTAFGRIGRWECNPRPKPMILATCNPSKNWVKKEVYDKYIAGTLPDKWLYIPSRVTDNPYLTPEYLEATKNFPPHKYKQFVEGDWEVDVPVNNPFLDDFIENQHVSPVPLKPNVHLPLILSIDFNLNPFCAIFAQEYKSETFVLEEISIENGNISKMCDAISKYMLDNGFTKAKLRVTGDAMGNRGEISQRDNASLYIQIMRELGIAKTQFEVKSNPKHSNSRADCNTVLRRLKVLISPNCKGLISDCLKVECGADGEILKKNRNKLEQRADFLDCFRYLCNTYLKKYI
jgi:hypothetical protein